MNHFFFVRLAVLLALVCGGMLSAASVSNLLHDRVGTLADATFSATSYIRMVYSLPKYNSTLGATIPAIYVQQAMVRRYYANNPSLSATMAVDATTPLELGPTIYVDWGDQPCISADGTKIAYRYTKYDATTYQPVVRCIASHSLGAIPSLANPSLTITISTATYYWREGNDNSGNPYSSGTPISAQPTGKKVDCRNPALSNNGSVLAFSSYNSDSVPGKYQIDCNPGGSWCDPTKVDSLTPSNTVLKTYRWKGSTNGWDGSTAYTHNTFWNYADVSTAANVGDADYPSIYTVPGATPVTYVAFSCAVKNTERWCSNPSDPTTIMRMEMEAPFACNAQYVTNVTSNSGIDLRTSADGFYGFSLGAADSSIFVYSTAPLPTGSKSYEVSQTASIIEYTDTATTANCHRLHAHTGQARRPCLAYDEAKDELYVSYETTGMMYAFSHRFAFVITGGDKIICVPTSKKIDLTATNATTGNRHPTTTLLQSHGMAFWDINNGWDVHMRRLPKIGSDATRCLNWTVTGRDFPYNSTTGPGQDTLDGTTELGRLCFRLTPNEQANFQGAEIGIDTKVYSNGSVSAPATVAAFLATGDCAYANNAFTTIPNSENRPITSISTTGVTMTTPADPLNLKWRTGYVLRISGSATASNNTDWTISSISGAVVTVKETGLVNDTTTAGIKVTVLRKSGVLSAALRRGPWANRNLISWNTATQRNVSETFAISLLQPVSSSEGGEWQYLGSSDLAGPAGLPSRNRFAYLLNTTPLRLGQWMNTSVNPSTNGVNPGHPTTRIRPYFEPGRSNYIELVMNPAYTTLFPGAPIAALQSLCGRKIQVLGMRSYFGYYNWCEEFTLAENPPPGMGGHIDGRGLEPEATYIDQSGLIYGIYGEYQYSVASTVPFQIKFWQRNPPLIKQHLSRASLSNDGRFALYQSQWLSEEALPDTVNNVGSEFVSLQLLNPIGPCDAP